jgi:hypothetical protein
VNQEVLMKDEDFVSTAEILILFLFLLDISIWIPIECDFNRIGIFKSKILSKMYRLIREMENDQ